MKNLFVIQDTTIQPIEPYMLSVDKINDLIIDFKNNKAPEDIFLHSKIPVNVINAVIKDVNEIKATSIRLMNGKSVKEQEINGPDELFKEAVYYDIPSDQSEFMTSMGELIMRDFSLKAQPIYSISDPLELVPFITEVLSNLIQYCDGTGSADWNRFVEIITE